MDFPFKRRSDPEPDIKGQITGQGNLLKQMEALNVAGVLHLTDAKGPRQYFVIRLPDAVTDQS